MAKILIITGPQGSGNHLYSKIFAMHPLVNGWKMNDFVGPVDHGAYNRIEQINVEVTEV